MNFNEPKNLASARVENQEQRDKMEIKHTPPPYTIRPLKPHEEPATGLGIFEIAECTTSPYANYDATLAMQQATAAWLTQVANSYAALTASFDACVEALEEVKQLLDGDENVYETIITALEQAKKARG